MLIQGKKSSQVQLSEQFLEETKIKVLSICPQYNTWNSLMTLHFENISYGIVILYIWFLPNLYYWSKDLQSHFGGVGAGDPTQSSTNADSFLSTLELYSLLHIY